MIQARGNSGTPEARHCSAAAAKASCAASSATSKSPTSRIRVATIRPQSARYVASTAALASKGICDVRYFCCGCRSRPPPFDSVMEGHVKYMLLICRDEQAWDRLSPAERQQVYRDTVKIQEELIARGQHLDSAPLYPSSSATSVRVRDGKRLVTDGPFAETREQLGGYMLIDVKDLDEAIGIAARIPLARTSTVEIRPVRDGAPS